jgi:Zn-dependent protease
MAGLRQGSLHLATIAGIDLFLHWSWFIVAVIEIEGRTGAYSSVSWNVLEYLALFFIVTLHEFGHALACRQTGGIANRIVLWPLGGVAFVQPPPRPGAMLWSIAAGPLVNVALFPLLSVLWLGLRSAGFAAADPNAYALARSVWIINLILLVFNLLPIYPLDGGQILRSLLWFVVGRARSLMVVTVIGFAGVAGLFALAIATLSLWTAIIAAFVLLSCWGGLRQSRMLLRLAKAPRRSGFACPSCKTAPPTGDYWVCNRCKKHFDTFMTNAVCPQCALEFPVARCLDCGRVHPMAEWLVPAVAAARG